MKMLRMFVAVTLVWAARAAADQTGVDRRAAL